MQIQYLLTRLGIRELCRIAPLSVSISYTVSTCRRLCVANGESERLSCSCAEKHHSVVKGDWRVESTSEPMPVNGCGSPSCERSERKRYSTMFYQFLGKVVV